MGKLTGNSKRKATRLAAGMGAMVWACAMLAGCTKSSSQLSPARNIAGTWKGTINDTVYYLTNCNSNSVYTYYTYQSAFTFVITAQGDSTITAAIYGTMVSAANDDCGENPPPASGYPITYNGYVSGSTLTLTDYIYGMNTSGVIEYANFDVGNFSFTSSLMAGQLYWVQYYSSDNAIGWRTSLISLTKQ